ncbi:hypothetical protein HHI36_008990 [Cryptolaemus montrouzieri]|uniref:THAP-type domain-containing protein n=1 Tax=Cryptolaemus montrouzieri TaxID=559131 RepID=A0ABD2MU57_9CUCU
MPKFYNNSKRNSRLKKRMCVENESSFRREKVKRQSLGKKFIQQTLSENLNHQRVPRIKEEHNQKKMYKCCVPLCNSYGPLENFVTFPPCDSDQRQLWLAAIPRKNWVVCHNTLLCKNHFDERTIHKMKDEKLLSNKAIPTIFPEITPTNQEEKYKKIDKKMFQNSADYVLPETFGDLERIPNYDDFIFDFLL